MNFELAKQRRSAAPHRSMFLRMLIRAAVLRRGRAAAALLAMVVAAGVTTAILNLYVDTQTKLREQFRNYGANIVVVAREGQALPADALRIVNSTIAQGSLAVPFGYVVARTPEGRSVVVSGTDFDKVRKLDKWWSVTAWPQTGAEAKAALVGIRAAKVVTPEGKAFDLSFRGRTIHLAPAGMLKTGAAEDNRVYLSLSDFESWTGLQPSTIEIAVSGSAQEVNGTIRNLQRAFPDAEVRPVRQIVEGEARVLVINGFFAAEAAALGAVGSVLGFALGVGAATWIGRVNFHAPVAPRLGVFPVVLAGSIVVALLAAIAPITLLQRLAPASILRGE